MGGGSDSVGEGPELMFTLTISKLSCPISVHAPLFFKTTASCLSHRARIFFFCFTS
jgi:hypothetical protein